MCVMKITISPDPIFILYSLPRGRGCAVGRGYKKGVEVKPGARGSFKTVFSQDDNAFLDRGLLARASRAMRRLLWSSDQDRRPMAAGQSPNGDPPGTRTPNLVIKSHLLCQLS